MNLPSRINLFGFSIGRTGMFVAVGLILLVIYKIGKVVVNGVSSALTFFGIKEDDAMSDNLAEIDRAINSDPKIKAHKTTANRELVARLDHALSGFLYDIDEIYNVFRSIQSKDQMKAIASIFGRQSYNMGLHSGTLAQVLDSRLWGYQLNKNLYEGQIVAPWSISKKLEWLKQ